MQSCLQLLTPEAVDLCAAVALSSTAYAVPAGCCAHARCLTWHLAGALRRSDSAPVFAASLPPAAPTWPCPAVPSAVQAAGALLPAQPASQRCFIAQLVADHPAITTIHIGLTAIHVT